MTHSTKLLRQDSRRVRHEPRRRWLTVGVAENLTPHMRRIRFSGDLDGFVSLSPDDHIKLFFADDAGGTAMRDYTPRAFDLAAGELVIDFAMHDAGPATRWAANAKPGDRLEIGGPRASLVVADDFDWFWLIGDETALPAIGRWVESLGPNVPVLSAVCVADHQEVQMFDTAAAWTGVWVPHQDERADADLLIEALERHAFPPGDGYIFIAAEADVARRLRAYCSEERGHSQTYMKASGYWKRGIADAHERIKS